MYDPHEADHQQHLDDLAAAHIDGLIDKQLIPHDRKHEESLTAALSTFLNLDKASDEDLCTLLGVHFPGHYEPGTEFICDAYEYWVDEREEYNDPGELAAELMCDDFCSDLKPETAWEVYVSLRLYEQPFWIVDDTAPFITIAAQAVIEVVHQLYATLETLAAARPEEAA